LVTSLAFGLATASLVSLFVVPAIYTIFDDLGLSELARERRALQRQAGRLGEV
jgi:hypothetical protein